MKKIRVLLDNSTTPDFTVFCSDDQSDLLHLVGEHLLEDPEEKAFLHNFALDSVDSLFPRFLRDSTGDIFTPDAIHPEIRSDLVLRFAGNDKKLQRYSMEFVRKNVSSFFENRLDYISLYLQDAERFLEDVFQDRRALHLPIFPWPEQMYLFAWLRLMELYPGYLSFQVQEIS